MEYADIKEWLDSLITNAEERYALQYFNESVYLVSQNNDNTIQIYEGIEIVADVMGLTINISTLNCCDGNYFLQKSIKYSNYTFFELLKVRKEEYMKVGNQDDVD